MERFSARAGDPLSAEHEAVSAWVEEASGTLDDAGWYKDVELKSLPSGQTLLAADPALARRYVLAAVHQARHWEEASERAKATASTPLAKMNPHMIDGYKPAWSRRRQ